MTQLHNMKNLLIISFLLIEVTTFSQNYKPGKSGGGLYGTGQNSIDKGWYFGLGGTYTLGYLTEKGDATLLNTSIEYKGNPCGNFGPYAEIGLFRMNDRKIINYMDYGIAYKWFRGGEDFTSQRTQNGFGLPENEVEGRFSDHYISGHFNVGYRWDKSEDKFYVNGLGLNMDYSFIASRSPTPAIPGKKYEPGGPASLLGEVHYFFGIGFKTGKRLIIMPIVETPVFAILPFNHIISTHHYNNSRNRRIIFRVRFMFLKKGSKSCPAVYNPMGIDPNNQLEK